MKWSNLVPLNSKLASRSTNFTQILPFIIAVSFYACSSDTQKEKGKAPQVSLPGINSGCYQLNINHDTAFMRLNVEGNKASGILVYKPFEKDKNEGTFIGNIVNDTLTAWYRFKSEGMISVRQIKMKVVKNGFAEGYGDMDMTHDTAYFKYPYTLRYEDDHTYWKINCP